MTLIHYKTDRGHGCITLCPYKMPAEIKSNHSIATVGSLNCWNCKHFMDSVLRKSTVLCGFRK